MPNYPNNHRPPCAISVVSGEVIVPFNGLTFSTCFNHFKSGETGLPLYTNVTKRIDYHDEVDPAGVSPYFRYHLNHPSVLSCIPADAYCHGEQPDTPYCELANYATDQIGCTGGDSSYSNGVFYNCFHKETGTLDYASCRKLGWKNVFAKKGWWGRFAFDSTNNGGYDSFDWCFQNCKSLSYQASCDRTKYLTLSGSGHYEYNAYGDSGELTHHYEGDATAYTSLGRYNGGATTSCSESSIDPEGQEGLFGNFAMSLISAVNGDNTDIQQAYRTILNGDGMSLGLWGVLGNPTSIAGGGNTWALEWDFGGGNKYQLSITSGNSLVLDSWGYDGLGALVGHSHYAESAIGTHHHKEVTTFSAGTVGGNGTYVGSADAYLSNPYTDADVLSDITGLLGTWDLGNDVQYPWRTDTNLLNGPFVTYAEQANALFIPYCSGDDGLAGRTPDPYYDGSILGKPHPYNGAAFWDDRFEVWESCRLPEDINAAWYIRGYGASSPFPSATQWVNEYERRSMLPFGFLQFDGLYLRAAKFAETQITRPSVNYARPCGVDRFQIGESTCISLIDGNTVTLLDSGPAPDISTDDYCYVCGMGVWKVAKVSDYVFTLVTQIATEDALTQYSAKPIYDCGDGQFAKLRWNWNYVPPMCGPLDIASVSFNTGVVLNLANFPAALVSGDSIRIYGAPSLNGIRTVSGVSGSNVLLSGINTGSVTPYTGGGYVQSVFGVDPYWNDDRSKGEFQYKSWHFNYRDVGEYQRLVDVNAGLTGGQTTCDGSGFCSAIASIPEPRPYQAAHGMPQAVSEFSCTTHCLPFKVCSPNVLAVTPNNESFATSIQANFVTDFPCDSLYGSEWHGKFEQMVKDPFWKATPCKCSYSEDSDSLGRIPCSEDDGTCLEDDPEGSYTIYPHAPMVEPRCDVPSGAPALVPGVHLGCLTLSQLNTTGSIEGLMGSVCSHPTHDGTSFAPWVLYLNELNCVCVTGRFDAEYEANRVLCKDSKTAII